MIRVFSLRCSKIGPKMRLLRPSGQIDTDNPPAMAHYAESA
ncbi:hypothetical protein [Novosphingobium sp.]|nr:hypothetical protein [Novosphingobium sp.]MDP3906630.1 hypothetical protein [Novosphingobium sp.]